MCFDIIFTPFKWLLTGLVEAWNEIKVNCNFTSSFFDNNISDAITRIEYFQSVMQKMHKKEYSPPLFCALWNVYKNE